MAGPLTLSMKELDRLQVLTRIAERRLTRRRAAGLLQIGERQVRRLYRAFVQDGAAWLVSRRRGRPSARRLPAATQERALALIRERYADFTLRRSRRSRSADLAVHDGPKPAASNRLTRDWRAGGLLSQTKPVVIFGHATKLPAVTNTVLVNDVEKELHAWQQTLSAMRPLVARLSIRGALVGDTSVGTGTTGVAALALGRRFLGSDIDAG